jgi:drug/metabolite transporter (DMT)-like permease
MWRRWQDWVVVALGVILFVTPFVFGETSQTVAASSAYVLGVLIALAGLLNAAARQAAGLEIIPVVLAVILFVIPFAFGFASVTSLAWSAWIIAILVALVAGSLFVLQNRRAMAS